MKTLGALLLATLLNLAQPAQAGEPATLARIGAQIEQHAVVRAEFVQTKTMAALKRPLVTTGRLTFSREHGVLWQIEQPYRMTYVLGEDRIVEIGSDGVRRQRTLREVPGLAQVGRVFRALLAANATALQDYFTVAVNGETDRWQIQLVPRQAQMAQFLTGIELTGARFVERIVIGESGGDSTQIQLRTPQGASTPNAAELQLFGAQSDSPAAR